MMTILRSLIGLDKRVTNAPSAEIAETPQETLERQASRRSNAVVHYAQRAAKGSLDHGDKVGAISDMCRALRQHGWDAPWLDAVAFDAMRSGDAAGFVNGFSCDHEDATRWLAENDL